MTQKLVNGELVDLTAEEIAEFAALQSAQPPLSPIEAWRFEAAIEIAGIKDDIDAAIEAMQGAEKAVAKAKRARVQFYYRDDPLIASLAVVLGMTSEEVDALWLSAMGL